MMQFSFNLQMTKSYKQPKTFKTSFEPYRHYYTIAK